MKGVSLVDRGYQERGAKVKLFTHTANLSWAVAHETHTKNSLDKGGFLIHVCLFFLYINNLISGLGMFPGKCSLIVQLLTEAG